MLSNCYDAKAILAWCHFDTAPWHSSFRQCGRLLMDDPRGMDPFRNYEIAEICAQTPTHRRTFWDSGVGSPTKFTDLRVGLYGQNCGMGYATYHTGPGEESTMTAISMRCAVDHFLRNGFLRLQYRLRRLGLPRQAVVKGLFTSERLLKGLKILR